MFLLMLVSCVTSYKTGYLVSAVQLQSSSIPITGEYEVGPWVEAYGCDYIKEEKEFSVASLVMEAQGRNDGLINIVVEQVDEFKWYTSTSRSSGKELSSGSYLVNGRCFKVRGQPVRLLNPPKTMEGVSTLQSNLDEIQAVTHSGCRKVETCSVVCSDTLPENSEWYSQSCGDTCVKAGVECLEPAGSTCNKSEVCEN